MTESIVRGTVISKSDVDGESDMNRKSDMSNKAVMNNKAVSMVYALRAICLQVENVFYAVESGFCFVCVKNMVINVGRMFVWHVGLCNTDDKISVIGI